MSRLSRENIDDQIVLMRDGVSLHSRRDPLREAQAWAEEQSTALRAGALNGPVFILGSGAGHHLRALSELRPELHLVSVDFDTEVLSCSTDFDLILSFREALRCESKIALIFATSTLMDDSEKKQLFGKGYSVLRFRPAWAGYETEFAQLEASLLDATAEALIPWYEASTKSFTGFEDVPENNSEKIFSDDEKIIMALKEVVV